MAFQAAFHSGPEQIPGEGLGNVIVGSCFHRLNSRNHRTKSRHHDNAGVRVMVTDVHKPTLTEQEQQYKNKIAIAPIPEHCTVAWGILDVPNDDHAEHKEKYEIVADKGCLDFFMPGVTKKTRVVKHKPEDVLKNLCQLLNKTEGLAMYINNTMHLRATVEVLKNYLQEFPITTCYDTSFGGIKSCHTLCDEMWYSGPHDPTIRTITTKFGRKVFSNGYNYSHCFALNIGTPFTWPDANEGDACTWHEWHKIPSKRILHQVTVDDGWDPCSYTGD